MCYNTIMFDFKDFDQKINDIKDWLASEFKSVQTGRATPVVLDNVYVEAYGSTMQLSHLASITLEDAKTLRVMPYDKSGIRDMEKAINDANLGLSVVSDSDGLRVIFPMLTTERRQQYVKIIKDKMEEARVRLKSAREDVKKKIEQGGKDSEYGKDEEKRLLDNMQSKVDSANGDFETLFNTKEKDILGE